MVSIRTTLVVYEFSYIWIVISTIICYNIIVETNRKYGAYGGRKLGRKKNKN